MDRCFPLLCIAKILIFLGQCVTSFRWLPPSADHIWLHDTVYGHLHWSGDLQGSIFETLRINTMTAAAVHD